MSIHQNLPPGVGVHDIPGNESVAVAVAAPRGHRKRFNKHLRVFLAGTVDTSTDRQVNRWAGKSLSIGRVLDQIVAFAAKNNFKPNRTKK